MRGENVSEQRSNLLDIRGASVRSSVWGRVDMDGHQMKGLGKN